MCCIAAADTSTGHEAVYLSPVDSFICALGVHTAVETSISSNGRAPAAEALAQIWLPQPPWAARPGCHNSDSSCCAAPQQTHTC